MLSPRFRRFLWPAGVLVGLAAAWLAFDWGEPTRWIPDLLVGWTFIGAGLVVAARRPESRSGPLMVATGFTWFLPNFATVAPGIVATLTASAIYVHRGPLIHLLLGYPIGRITSGSARAVVAVGYVASVAPLVWGHEGATLVLVAPVVVVAAREYRKAVGPPRRARLVALIATSGFALAIIGGAITRLVLPVGEVSYAALLSYQTTLIAIALGLTAGLNTSFWGGSELTDLVVELGAERPSGVRAALARAIGDPSLEIGYWIPASESFVDSDGRSLDLPDGDSGRIATIVEGSGEPIAALIHHPAILDDPALLEAVTSAAQLAAANARLRADVRARAREVEASRRRILSARDDERRRLEHRLHDGAELRLEHLRLTLERGLHSASSRKTVARIIEADAQLGRTIEDLHLLAQGLHPRVLTEQGLPAAVASLADGLPFPVQVRATTGEVSRQAQVAAYFTCAEALANVAKHASASAATVSVSSNGSVLTVVVEDDGVGGADFRRGSGLLGLADRIATLGGSLRIDDNGGTGTRVVAEIPLGDDAI